MRSSPPFSSEPSQRRQWIACSVRATGVAVREYSTARLAHFKIPRSVHIVEGFPMTITGKVRRVAMREMARAHPRRMTDPQRISSRISAASPGG